jgi:hypothetical protein
MDGPNEPNVSWTRNQGKVRQLVAAVSLVALVLVGIIFRSDIKDFFSGHPWWQGFLAALPGIALAILAYLELRHSQEATKLQNRIAELEDERNIHLQQIAENTKKPVTQAERNAEILRRYLGASIAVSEGGGVWPGSPEIVELKDGIVTLFTPGSYSSPVAWCVQVHCGELEIAEIPQGSWPLRLKILKRYGPNVDLGQISKWEDRHKPASTQVFTKGGVVRHATYNKPGSPETRSLYVHASKNGNNWFLLEASTGQSITGDNREISKQFMVLQADYEAEGFNCNSSSTSGSPYPLFIH